MLECRTTDFRNECSLVNFVLKTDPEAVPGNVTRTRSKWHSKGVPSSLVPGNRVSQRSPVKRCVSNYEQKFIAQNVDKRKRHKERLEAFPCRV